MSTVGIAPTPLSTLHRSPRCLDDSILIYLSMSGSQPIPMRILSSESVASVKLRIQNCKGFVVGKQRLVFSGRELAWDESRLRDYGVGDGSLLHLLIRLSELREIHVRTTCGRTFEFRVGRNRSVRFLKEEVRRKVGGLSGCELVCDGEELADGVVIGDISKDSYNAAVHLLVRESVKVRSRSVGSDVELMIMAPESEEWVEVDEGERKPWLEPIVGNPKAAVFPVIQELICSAFGGLDNGRSPVRSTAGSGGVYFMLDELGKRFVAVFKPVDEEPMASNNPQGLPLSLNGEGLKRGTRVGEGALREVAAYILDHPFGGRRMRVGDGVGFSGVPPTTMVRCFHEGFSYHSDCGYVGRRRFKVGSLQMFVENIGSCEDIGPKFFPVEEVHKISVLDIRLANADRHAGNILVCKEGEEGKVVLVPIDHGYCLPENFEDCTFEWLYWPQARKHYNSETVDYIKSLDAEQDLALLKFYGWELSAECARTLRISTMLLKKGVERGFTPFMIGSMMCRETVKTKSVIEEIVDEARETILPGSYETSFMDSISEIMDRRLDELSL